MKLKKGLFGKRKSKENMENYFRIYPVRILAKSLK